MSTNPYAQFFGRPMRSEDIDELLETQGYGILSLCGDGAPYSIPVSFGYDGESIYLGLLDQGAESTKMEYIEDGATVRLLVTDIRGRFDWQSVAVTGPASRLDDGGTEREHCLETLVDNGWFMKAFERSDAIESLEGWKLEMEHVEGQEQTEEVHE